MDFAKQIAREFGIQEWQVANVISLIDEGNTIPFIARYRKEAHGTLDDQVLRELEERLQYLRNLSKRREEVYQLIVAAGGMTPALEEVLNKAETLAEIEDLYRPFRPKRKTRASVAREKGLGPLADWICQGQQSEQDPMPEAEKYIDPEKGVHTAGEALAGARDILAEQFSDDADIRRRLRNLMQVTGLLQSKGDPAAESVYTLYYDYQEALEKMASHRILAVDRGEKEGFLKVSILLDPIKAHNALTRDIIGRGTPCGEIVREAALDAYDRLIFPSLEREMRAALRERAAVSAIKVFSENLRNLLMQPPVKGKVTLGLDPAYRTGCKFAVVDATGKVLDTGVIYPVPPHNKKEEAQKLMLAKIARYGIELIAIGNGTASKETEIFAVELLQAAPVSLQYLVVSEAGASVYSASKLAAEEFPEFDVSLRSAVSIARRLQDPLSELVKIDPKAVGVGQYQHDMPKAKLEEALDHVLEDCVNAVGVDLNTASVPLLQRVAGVNATLAKNIVAYREEQGPYLSRSALKKVPKLGAKAFQQCAGFLRILESENVLDRTGVHPEAYAGAKTLMRLCGYTGTALQTADFADLPGRMEAYGTAKAAEEIGMGLPTLRDIVKELTRPGRDPREELPQPMLRTDILEMKDLQVGMVLDGTVRNVTDFGAFVDIGVHQDGLVHISELCERFIRHPGEAVKLGDLVKVRVLKVEPAKKRISLSMRFSEKA